MANHAEPEAPEAGDEWQMLSPTHSVRSIATDDSHSSFGENDGWKDDVDIDEFGSPMAKIDDPWLGTPCTTPIGTPPMDEGYSSPPMDEDDGDGYGTPPMQSPRTSMELVVKNTSRQDVVVYPVKAPLLFDTKYSYIKEVTEANSEKITVKVGMRLWGFRQDEDGKRGAAELADVKLGDVLASINGQDVCHSNFDDIINTIKTNEKWPLFLTFKPLSVLNLPKRKKPKKTRRKSTTTSGRATSLLTSASLLMKKLSNVASGSPKVRADPLTVQLFTCGQKGNE